MLAAPRASGLLFALRGLVARSDYFDFAAALFSQLCALFHQVGYGADGSDSHGRAYHQAAVAFGSTTGNVYLSENRGESWLCLGNNFPPVYSVHFID